MALMEFTMLMSRHHTHKRYQVKYDTHSTFCHFFFEKMGKPPVPLSLGNLNIATHLILNDLATFSNFVTRGEISIFQLIKECIFLG